MTDVGWCPIPDLIVTRFADDFQKLLWLTLMSPCGKSEEKRRFPRLQSAAARRPPPSPRLPPNPPEALQEPLSAAIAFHLDEVAVLQAATATTCAPALEVPIISA